MKTRFFAFLCIAFCASSAQAADWAGFLKTPTHDAYMNLRDGLQSGPQTCAVESPTAGQTTQLFALIASGNAEAFAGSMLVSQCFGVGDLEHFYRATGMFAEKSPGAFLEIATAFNITDDELPFMLTLSSPGAKNGDADAAELDKRSAALQGIKEDAVADLQKRAVLILAKARAAMPK